MVAAFLYTMYIGSRNSQNTFVHYIVNGTTWDGRFTDFTYLEEVLCYLPGLYGVDEYCLAVEFTEDPCSPMLKPTKRSLPIWNVTWNVRSELLYPGFSVCPFMNENNFDIKTDKLVFYPTVFNECT
jgi:hypothetical protein